MIARLIRTIIFTLLITNFYSFITAKSDSNPYTAHAASWIKQYISPDGTTLLVTTQDLHYIANLLYFSYYRSKITLDAQESTINALETIWQSFENIEHTRLNPSRNLPHTIDAQHQRALIENFLLLAPAHKIIGKTYAQATEEIVNGTLITSASAAKGIQSLRSQARIVVAQAISTLKDTLGSLYCNAHRSTQNALETITAHENTANRSIDLLGYLWDYIPQLAVNSFVEADKLNNTVTHESWNALQAMLTVGTQTWQTIEQERSNFYRAHYSALCTLMENLEIPQDQRTILFDEQGLLPIDKQNSYLPDATNLP